MKEGSVKKIISASNNIYIPFTLSLISQIFSEAPVTISEKGERLSNMIYVKFKPGELIDIPKDKKEVDGNFIVR